MLLYSRSAAVQPVDHVCVLDTGYGVARPGGVEFAAAGRVHYYFKGRARSSGYLIGGVLFGIEVDFVVLVPVVAIMPLGFGAVLESFTIDKTYRAPPSSKSGCALPEVCPVSLRCSSIESALPPMFE